MNELNVGDAFSAITKWALEAAQSQSHLECPDVAPLRFILASGSAIRRVSSQPHIYGDLELIEFDIDRPKDDGVLTRYMLPVHFAITRLLELIPGVSVRMRGDTHPRPNDDRAADDLIFALEVRYSASFRRSFDFKDGRLERILFNAAPGVRLHERRTGNYRYIIPSSFVPIRTRGLNAHNASDWMRVVDRAVRQGNENTLLVAPSVLRRLFVTSERWHWLDLIDRLQDDPRISPR